MPGAPLEGVAAGMSNRNGWASTAIRRKGGPSCSVCNHPKRDEFDKALVGAGLSQAAVAKEIGCDRASVNRHFKNHLLKVARNAPRIEGDPRDLNIMAELKRLYSRMTDHLQMAEVTDNWPAIRAFHAEARQDLELLAKLLGKIEAQTVNVLVSGDWQAARVAMFEALADFPEARIAVSERLMELGA